MNKEVMESDTRILTKQDFMMEDENIHIQLSAEFPDYIGVPHKHKFIEVIYVISGSAVHEIEGETSVAKRGDLFIINMDITHVFRYGNNSDNEPFVAYDLKFTPEFFDRSVTGYQPLESLNNSYMFYSLLHNRNEYTPYLNVSGSSHAYIGDLFNRIYFEYRSKNKGYIEIIRSYLTQLIITVFRETDKKESNEDMSSNKQVVNYITDYIKSNYKSNISTKILASQVYMSSDYLGRLFRRETGMTISEMIQKVRIESACYLLSATNRTISDIAISCGFDDVKFFYTVFKRLTGILPGDYRKKTQQDKQKRGTE